MKRCPTCSRVYDDVSLRFCFDDGTELENKVPAAGAPETLVMPGQPPTIQAQPPGLSARPAAAVRRPPRIWPWVLGAGALFVLLIIGIVASRVFHFSAKKPLVYHLVLHVRYDYGNRDYLAQSSAAVIKSRLNALGISNFHVTPGTSGSGEILVDLPRLENPERVKRIISNWGNLELSHVVSPPNPSPPQTFTDQAQAESWLKQNPNFNATAVSYRDQAGGAAKWVIVDVPAIISGYDLSNATAVPSAGASGNYDVEFSLKEESGQRLGSWTSSHINEYLAIVLDGEAKSLLSIKSQITDRGLITGRYNREAAEDLALVLNSGALPVPVEFLEEKIDN